MKLKRILAASLAVSMLSAVSVQFCALADAAGDIVTLSPDVSGSTVTVTTEGSVPRSGIVIHASYNSDGSLKAVETQDFKNVTAEASDEVTLDFTYSIGDKLFAWQSLSDMEPYEAEVETDFIVDYAKVQDLGWSQFVVAQFEDGYSLENTTLKVDGTDVTSAFTPVTTDGSVVKWEITSLNPAKLTVTKADKGTQTITLSDNENPTAAAAETDTTAGYMIAHGPMAIWDYYLTVYDKDGAIRVEPKETTINLTGTDTTDAPAAYSPEAEIKEDGTGAVEIMFNYNKDWEKTWFDAVKDRSGSVELVTYDENKYVLNNHLSFKKTANAAHGSGKVGLITVELGQDNFRTNGRYYIRVRSEGHDSALVPVHVVNETAPTLSVTAQSDIRSGENVTFKIGNMIYGITNPTYAAELTRPDGKTVELEMITDWYQIGDNLYLYNSDDADGNSRNKIPYKGEYTLTVHSNGFKDMSVDFTVSQGEEVPVAANLAAYGIDIMSSATYSSSTSGSSSSDAVSGGQQISADVKFNADLLINSIIIAEQLKIENYAAQAICDRWNSMMPDSVSAADTNLGGFDWNDYYSAVSNARNEGEYLSFAEYADKNFNKEKTTVPHSVKSVLENNLLGDIQYDAEWVGRDCPFMALVKQNNNGEWEYTDKVMVGEDINIICYGTEYLSSLSGINLNGNSSDLKKDTDYTLSVSQNGEYMLLTISTENQSLLNVNNTNTVTLKAAKYKTNTLYIPYEREMEQNLSLETDSDTYTRGENGTEVEITVNNSKGDFLNYLDKIEVTTPDSNKKNVLSAATGGTSSYYYTKTDNNTVKLTDSTNTLFADNGEYTIKLMPSQYYNALDTVITVNGALKAVPNDDPYIYSEVDNTYSKPINHYLLDFGQANRDSGISEWQSAVKSVTVNGTEYSKTDMTSSLTDNMYVWNDPSGQNNAVMKLYGLTAFKDGGENAIVIKAAGYDDLTIIFNSLADRTAPEFDEAEKTEAGNYRITFSGTDDEINKFLKRLTTVTVGATRYLSSGISNNSIYTLVKAEGSELYTMLDLAPNAVNEYGTTSVTITAKGYNDLEFNIDNGERPILPPPSVDSGSLTTKIEAVQSGDTDHYRVAFTGNEGVVDAYLAKVTAVTVGETSYTDITDSFYSSLSSSLYRRTKDGDIYKYLDIAANGIPDYEAETEITVTATGYSELKFKIDNKDKHMPYAPAQKAITPNYGSKDYYSVSFDGEAADVKKYLAAISAVTVGETKYELATGFSSYTTNKYKIGSDGAVLDLTNDAIPSDSATTVTIEAAGYHDGTVTIDPRTIEKDTPPAGLENVSESAESAFSPAYYSLAFTEDEDGDASEYVRRITGVTISETPYSMADSLAYNSTNTFAVSGGKLLITKEAVGETGNTNVAITAKGYTDKTYTITIKDAPGLDGEVTLVDNDGDVEYYRVKIQGTDNEVNEYLSKVLTLKADNNKYTKTDSEFKESDYLRYRLTTDGEEAPKYVYLDFTADGLAKNDETTVTITAECYAPLTFKLGSADDRLEAPAVAGKAKTEDSTYASYGSGDYAYYRISFNGDDSDVSAYLQKIKSVTVGAREYTKLDGSYFNSPSMYKYRIKYADNDYSYKYKYLDLTAYGIPEYDVDTTIVVSAEGYKDCTFVIENSANKSAAAPEYDNAEYVHGETTDYYTVTFRNMDSEELSAYLKAITSVTVGEKAYDKETTFSGASYVYSYKLGYADGSSSVYATLDLTDDYIPETGKTSVTVTAKGYTDMTFEIDNSGVTLSAPPEFKTFTAQSTSDYYGTIDYYAVELEGNNVTEFLNNIKSVSVRGQSYSETDSFSSRYTDCYVIDEGKLCLQDSSVKYKGITAVTVKARGYEELTFNIDTSDREVVSAPVVSAAEFKSSSYSQNYYRITFDGSEDDVQTYLKAVTYIAVNGQQYSEASYSMGQSNYIVNYSYLTNYKYVLLDIADNAFTENGNTEITVEAKGYEDLTFTIDKDGKIVKE